MKRGTTYLELVPTQIQPNDGITEGFSAATFEPPNSTDLPERSFSYGEAGQVSYLCCSWFSISGWGHISFLFFHQHGKHGCPLRTENYGNKFTYTWHDLGRSCRPMLLEQAADLLGDTMWEMESFVEDQALIAGWKEQGPFLYLVDKYEGVSFGCRFIVGSPLENDYRALDTGLRHNMSNNEAVSFARWAICSAALKDGARCGVVSVYHVGPKGWMKLFGLDVKSYHGSTITLKTVDQDTKEDEMEVDEMEVDEMEDDEIMY